MLKEIKKIDMEIKALQESINAKVRQRTNILRDSLDDMFRKLLKDNDKPIYFYDSLGNGVIDFTIFPSFDRGWRNATEIVKIMLEDSIVGFDEAEVIMNGPVDDQASFIFSFSSADDFVSFVNKNNLKVHQEGLLNVLGEYDNVINKNIALRAVLSALAQ